MRSFRFVALAGLLLAIAMAFLPMATAASAAGESTVVITSTTGNVRAAPNTSSDIVAVLNQGDVVQVVGTVSGEVVNGSSSTWYQTANGHFIYSGIAAAGSSSSSSVDTQGMSGRWILVDHATSTAKAIENGQVVYTAYVTLGTPQYPTPYGTFRILRRVANETMDSSTVGIPLGTPGSYYLTNVLYTQYFTSGGAALHYNYWSPDSAFGSAAGSHGCVGMRLADARFFWDFATIGTPVVIR